MMPTICSASEIDPNTLRNFLRRFFSENKCNFILNYGNWFHKGNTNQWIVLVDSQIAGYCAVIPSEIIVDSNVVPSIWWIDLVIAPEYRGKGLQTLFDKKIQEIDCLKLGFPNLLSSKIHKKHGWYVREDLQVLMLPLRTYQIKHVTDTTGLKGLLLRSIGYAISPLAYLGRLAYQQYKPLTAQVWQKPEPEQLAAIFNKYYQPPLVTTNRSVDYFNWRYFQSPFHHHYCFYSSGPAYSPTHYLISRHVKTKNILRTRILDIFGDFQDTNGLKDILRLAIRDAILKGSSQVTLINSSRELSAHLQSVGFLVKSPTRFCWQTSVLGTMTAMSQKSYWTLADSDNDEPE